MKNPSIPAGTVKFSTPTTRSKSSIDTITPAKMKTFVAAALISLASVATAQLDNLPWCALSCFLTPLSTDGCAMLDDFACHCQKSESLFAAVVPCVQEACSVEDQATAIEAVESTCAAAGVTITVPNPTKE
ncbi:hypothetical protein CC80DRAFT_505481 [Byssothecium circinans]|uniref:CFEM domain-containing protein n=1 Tax=Byssothecium circinans TaxID=147558 RepID=A0A6A5TV14_9PLEO|nr:hypothetical protein CC80DRAFT_505481 [Byssothecium circinans]